MSHLKSFVNLVYKSILYSNDLKNSFVEKKKIINQGGYLPDKLKYIFWLFVKN